MPAPTAEASATIAAPIALVWEVVLDAARYGAWNPFVYRIDAASLPLGPGTGILLHVRWRNGKTTRSPERVSRLEPPAPGADGGLRALLAYVYEGLPARLGMIRGTRVQTLAAPMDGGPTTYHTHETFTGFAARFAPLADIRDGFARHAAALKTRAETLAAHPS